MAGEEAKFLFSTNGFFSSRQLSGTGRLHLNEGEYTDTHDFLSNVILD